MKALKIYRAKIENWSIRNWRIAIALPQLIFLIIHDPYWWGTIIAGSICFYYLWILIEKGAKYLGIKHKKTNLPIMIGVAVLIACFCMEQQASAVIYKRLEAFVTDLVAQTTSATGGTANRYQKSIELLFLLARGITVFLFLGSSIQAKRQKDDNQNPRLMIDIAIGTFEFVILVEVVSFMLVGGT